MDYDDVEASYVRLEDVKMVMIIEPPRSNAGYVCQGGSPTILSQE